VIESFKLKTIMSDLQNIYDKTKYLSIKYDSYFEAYEELLSKYRGKEITFVEVGVFNGGSLFMWRDYFGPQARIIGVDMNPASKVWESHGFEIHIGDQASQIFWHDFFRKVGSVDVFIDDGGHTNLQQITTVHCAVEHIRDGGVLIVEDVHTSYFKEFGNPWSRAFIGFAAKIVDGINSRSFALRTNRERYAKRVHSVSFFESIVALHINTVLCKKSVPTSNKGISQNASDFRYRGVMQSLLFSAKNKVANSEWWGPKIVSRAVVRLIDLLLLLYSRIEIIRHAKYWRDDVR
jgi:hypothetical protein